MATALTDEVRWRRGVNQTHVFEQFDDDGIVPFPDGDYTSQLRVSSSSTSAKLADLQVTTEVVESEIVSITVRLDQDAWDQEADAENNLASFADVSGGWFDVKRDTDGDEEEVDGSLVYVHFTDGPTE